MKNYNLPVAWLLFLLSALFCISGFSRRSPQRGYLLEHEKDIALAEAGPHQGEGQTTAFRFFKTAAGSKLQFSKRILHPGSSIGYHLQKDEEIYYIIDGEGEMTMNGEIFRVSAGDAILTLAGNEHGLKQTGTRDLIMIINYERK